MLGEGYMVILLFIVVLFRRQYLLGVHLLAAFLISGMTAQIIKEFTICPGPKYSCIPASIASLLKG